MMYGGYLYATNGDHSFSSYTGVGAQSKAAFTSGSTTLTAAQSGLPSHEHYVGTFPYSGSDAQFYCVSTSPGGNVNRNVTWTGGIARSNTAQNASQGHTHSIPAHTHNIAYIAVRVWKRTA